MANPKDDNWSKDGAVICHPGESRDPYLPLVSRLPKARWVPAFAGMTANSRVGLCTFGRNKPFALSLSKGCSSLPKKAQGLTYGRLRLDRLSPNGGITC